MSLPKTHPVDSCRYLQLIPTPEDTATIRRLVLASRDAPNSDEKSRKFDELVEFLRGDNENAGHGRDYEPHCTKLKGLCVCMESVVLSQKQFGGNYQPLFNTFLNRQNIADCTDREYPFQSFRGTETYDTFVLRRVSAAVASDLVIRVPVSS